MIKITPHVHLSPVLGVAIIALIVAVFGTTHLLSLTHDNRASRAFAALGF